VALAECCFEGNHMWDRRSIGHGIVRDAALNEAAALFLANQPLGWSFL